MNSLDAVEVDNPFDSYERDERESETEDFRNEAEMLGEEAREHEELHMEIFRAVRTAKRQRMSDADIMRAVNDGKHE